MYTYIYIEIVDVWMQPTIQFYGLKTPVFLLKNTY